MPYRILSLSGGGIRGLFQVEYLIRLKQLFKDRQLHQSCDLAEHFQLLAGTSTGAIIAYALSCGIDLSLVRKIFISHGKNIFHRNKSSYLFKGHLYSSKGLEIALKEIFTTTKVECRVPVLACATRLTNYTKVLLTAGGVHTREEVINNIMSSCAAPYYFPSHTHVGGEAFVDGGLWANSPALIAIHYAYSKLGYPPSDMYLVSLGNGRLQSGAAPPNYDNLFIKPLMKSILKMMFDTQAELAKDVVETFLNEGTHTFIDDDTYPFVELDGVDEAIRVLPDRARATAEATFHDVSALLKDDVSARRGTLINDIKRGLVRHGFDTAQLKPSTQLHAIISGGSYKRVNQIERQLTEFDGIDLFRFVNDDPIPAFREIIQQQLLPDCDAKGINCRPDDPSHTTQELRDIRERKAFAETHDGSYYLIDAKDLHLAFVVYGNNFRKRVVVYPMPLNRRVCNISESLCYEQEDAVTFWLELFDKLFAQAREKAARTPASELDKILELMGENSTGEQMVCLSKRQLADVCERTIGYVVQQATLPDSPCWRDGERHTLCAGALYVKAAYAVSKSEEDALRFEHSLVEANDTQAILDEARKVGVPTSLVRIFVRLNDSLAPSTRIEGITDCLRSLKEDYISRDVQLV